MTIKSLPAVTWPVPAEVVVFYCPQCGDPGRARHAGQEELIELSCSVHHSHKPVLLKYRLAEPHRNAEYDEVSRLRVEIEGLKASQEKLQEAIESGSLVVRVSPPEPSGERT